MGRIRIDRFTAIVSISKIGPTISKCMCEVFAHPSSATLAEQGIRPEQAEFSYRLVSIPASIPKESCTAPYEVWSWVLVPVLAAVLNFVRAWSNFFSSFVNSSFLSSATRGGTPTRTIARPRLTNNADFARMRLKSFLGSASCSRGWRTS